MTRDPILYEDGFNLYEYVRSNPVRFVDPDGLGPVTNNSQEDIPYKGERVVIMCLRIYSNQEKPLRLMEFILNEVSSVLKFLIIVVAI